MDLKNKEEVIATINELLYCKKFDSTESFIFSNPTAIGSYIVNAHKEELTYGDYIRAIDSIRNRPDFAELKAAALIPDELQKEKVRDLSNVKALYTTCGDENMIRGTNYNIVAFISHEDGLKCARQLNKPVLLYFTSNTCVNCSMMERELLQNKEIREKIENGFVFIEMAMEDNTPLPSQRQKYCKTLRKKVTTIGEENTAIQIETYNKNAQPWFVIVSGGKEVANQVFTKDIKEFLSFLDKTK